MRGLRFLLAIFVVTTSSWPCALPGADLKATIPIDVVFSIDSSGSMGPPPSTANPEQRRRYNKDPHKLRVQAVTQFLDKLDPAFHWAGLVSWDIDIDFRVPLTPEHDKVRSRSDQIDSDGGTDLNKGLRETLDVLQRSPRTYSKKIAVFLTDGIMEKKLDLGILEKFRQQPLVQRIQGRTRVRRTQEEY